MNAPRTVSEIGQRKKSAKKADARRKTSLASWFDI
jgi:hypothetical protein